MSNCTVGKQAWALGLAERAFSLFLHSLQEIYVSNQTTWPVVRWCPEGQRQEELVGTRRWKMKIERVLSFQSGVCMERETLGYTARP